jgi:hypothetical protein
MYKTAIGLHSGGKRSVVWQTHAITPSEMGVPSPNTGDVKGYLYDHGQDEFTVLHDQYIVHQEGQPPVKGRELTFWLFGVWVSFMAVWQAHDRTLRVAGPDGVTVTHNDGTVTHE